MRLLLSTITAGIFGAFMTAAVYADKQIIEAYPDHIKARLELRDRQVRERLPGRLPGGFSLQSVVTSTRRWQPGTVLTVAFNGGDQDLRKAIAEVAAEWTQHGNITFDFGTPIFREWKDTDNVFAADIRIGFAKQGYWSFVGTDSSNLRVTAPNEPSMNLEGFDVEKPASWKSIVLHEFGHALGFQHEHQNPLGNCDDEFRWGDDEGYDPGAPDATTNAGTFVPITRNGKVIRPGIYTVLGGPPNRWSEAKVNSNLRGLHLERAYGELLLSPHDPESIMHYRFPTWMFKRADSPCCVGENQSLSSQDKKGMAEAYPKKKESLEKRLIETVEMFESVKQTGNKADWLISPRLLDKRLDAAKEAKQGLR